MVSLRFIASSFLAAALGVTCGANAQSASQLLEARPEAIGLSPHDPLSPFRAEEAKAFFAAAAKADEITDPMQRCLHFPDPPGSHWTRAAVEEYCQYMLRDTITYQEVKRLVESGHAADIDRRLAEFARDKAGHPEAFESFISDKVFIRDDGRKLLEAWKQQVPGSAYAHAASGDAFLQQAWKARGAKWARETTSEQFEEMHTFAARADGDLRRAIKLDPTLGVAYGASLNSLMLRGEHDELAAMTKIALDANATSLSVFIALAAAAQPKWNGSAQAQQWVIDASRQRSAQAPLLVMIRALVLNDQMDITFCYCDKPEQRAYVRQVFDDMGSHQLLHRAGSNALDNKQYELAAVYLYEASRFKPDDVANRDEIRRAMADVDLDVKSP